MSEPLKKVALVIPVHNRRETTLQGLRSLARIDTTGLSVHTIIVDDGSTDGTSEAIRRDFPDVEIITGDGTLHYAAGTNRGVEAALSRDVDYIVTMNDDAVFHEQFLQRLIATAKKNPRSVVGALLLLWNEPHKVFQVGLSWNTLKGGWDIPDDLTAFSVPQQAFETECIVGNCVLFPAAAIKECGLMDEENFPHGWGDAQWTTRMRKMGWQLLIESKALVWCEPNTNPAPLHSLGIGKIFNNLFANTRHPANLKRQFDARWHSAPTKPQAVAAFGINCLSLAAKTITYSAKRLFGKTTG